MEKVAMKAVLILKNKHFSQIDKSPKYGLFYLKKSFCNDFLKFRLDFLDRMISIDRMPRKLLSKFLMNRSYYLHQGIILLMSMIFFNT